MWGFSMFVIPIANIYFLHSDCLSDLDSEIIPVVVVFSDTS